MKTQIPLFRAKKIDSDEYVFGSYFKDKAIHSIITHSKTDYADKAFYVNAVQINETTLAIHFPDMLDSEGNKIFASLSEDGRGGDLISHKGEFLESKEDLIAIYEYGSFRMSPLDFRTSFKLVEWVGFTVKVIGIKKWNHSYYYL